MLAKLHRAKLIETKPGTAGSNLLAPPSDDITLLDVFEAVSDSPIPHTRHPEGCVAEVLAGHVNSVLADAEQRLLAELRRFVDVVPDTIMTQVLASAVLPGVPILAPPDACDHGHQPGSAPTRGQGSSATGAFHALPLGI